MGKVKHFGSCYRNIKGVRHENYADLVMKTDELNREIVDEACRKFQSVKKIKHHSGGYYQLFVANPINNDEAKG